MDLVSVILPTYNRAKTIDRAITSVLSQSYRNLELIIVDDASTDNTFEIVKGFSDSRIKYFKLNKNVGGASARNFGIERAQGHLIAFQDSDDEWLSGKLKSDLKIFKDNKDVDCVFSRYWQVNDKFSKLVPMNSSVDSNTLYSSLLIKNMIGTPTAVIKRDVLIKVEGFNAVMPRYQDWELFIRVSKGFKVYMNQDINLIAYVSIDSVSNNNLAHLRALELIYEKHNEEISKKSALKALWLWNIGEAQALNSLEFRKTLLSSMSTQFSLIKSVKFIFLCLLGTTFYNKYRKASFNAAHFISGSRLAAWLKK